MSIYFTLIVESTENATWLLLERAYPIGGRLVHSLNLCTRRPPVGVMIPEAV